MGLIYEYRARIAYIHDADTVRLDVDCGFNVWLHRVPFRLAGIDAPELGTDEGRAARDWLRALLPVGTEVTALTMKDRGDKYGRYLVDIYEQADDMNSINVRLINAGHAVAYDGGAR